MPFQLSQRADYFECLSGVNTTFRRPVVNTRDEPLCGERWHPNRERARLHCIFFDTTLSHVATLLRVGMMQLALAMVEAGVVDPALALDDPLAAVGEWSRDPLLEASVPLLTGEPVTALALQRRFFDAAVAFVETDDGDVFVPRAREILTLWDDTLGKLERHDWTALAPRLDWVLKLSCIERALSQRPELHWGSPEVKHLDRLYSSVDHTEGLYWRFADQGLVERLVTDVQIAQAMQEPPRDTRAWGRTMLLRRGGLAIDDVDWDRVVVRLKDRYGDVSRWRLDLPDPLGATESQIGATVAGTTSMRELLSALGAVRKAAPAFDWRAIPSY